jgi:drug/metabolite transporter (DMT)-like permease
MLYLILAVLGNCVQALAVRFSEKNLHNRYAVTMCNYFFATALCYLMLGGVELTSFSQELRLPLLLGAGNGVVFISWLLLFQASVAKNGAALPVTFTKLGVLIPTIGSIAIFAERPGLLQLIGIAVALLALVMINLPQRQALAQSGAENAAPHRRFDPWLLLVLLIGGLGDFNSKIFESFGLPELDSLFLLVTFGVAFLLSIGAWLWHGGGISRRDLAFGALIGIPNQLTTFFLLQALMRLPAYLVFPVYSVGVILLISLLGLLLFGERLTRRQYLSIGLVCLALVCLNI